MNSDLKRKGEVRFTLIFPFFLNPSCNALENNRLTFTCEEKEELEPFEPRIKDTKICLNTNTTKNN